MRAAPAKWRRASAMAGNSTSCALDHGLPVSSTSRSANLESSRSNRSASWCSRRARSDAVRPDHWGNARDAARTAASTSLFVDARTAVIGSPVDGFTTAITSSELAATEWPSMKFSTTRTEPLLIGAFHRTGYVAPKVPAPLTNRRSDEPRVIRHDPPPVVPRLTCNRGTPARRASRLLDGDLLVDEAEVDALVLADQSREDVHDDRQDVHRRHEEQRPVVIDAVGRILQPVVEVEDDQAHRDQPGHRHDRHTADLEPARG